MVVYLAAADTCRFWCNPVGPGTPFGSPLLVFFDVIRLFCMFAGFYVFVRLPSCIRRVETRSQRSRFVSIGFFILVAIDTELSHLGDYASVRLLLTVLGLVWAIHGVYEFRKESVGHPRDPDPS